MFNRPYVTRRETASVWDDLPAAVPEALHVTHRERWRPRELEREAEHLPREVEVVEAGRWTVVELDKPTAVLRTRTAAIRDRTVGIEVSVREREARAGQLAVAIEIEDRPDSVIERQSGRKSSIASSLLRLPVAPGGKGPRPPPLQLPHAAADQFGSRPPWQASFALADESSSGSHCCLEHGGDEIAAQGVIRAERDAGHQ
jgi:hypothetical protein